MLKYHLFSKPVRNAGPANAESQAINLICIHTHTHTLEQPCVTQALEIRVAQLGFKNACPVFIVGAGIITAKD